MKRSIVTKQNIQDPGKKQNLLIEQKYKSRIKKRNRLVIFCNCIKEILFVVLFFIIVESQLKTREAMTIREELATRFDLILPDYVSHEETGFGKIENFHGFYSWLNKTFLPRVFMDPFYKLMKHEVGNWTKVVKGNDGMHILQEESDGKGWYGEDVFGFGWDHYHEVLPETDYDSYFKEMIKRRKELVKNLKIEIKETMIVFEDEEAYEEYKVRIGERIRLIEESLDELYLLRDESKEGKRVQFQTPNTYKYRLMEQDANKKLLLIGQNDFYFKQVIFKTVSPYYYNKLFTQIRMLSKLRKQQKIKDNLPDIIIEELDRGESHDVPYPYNSTLEGYYYDLPVFGQNLYQARENLKLSLRDGLINNRSFELQVSCASINSNTYMISYITLKLKLSSSGMFEKKWDIHTFRLDPYLHNQDLVRLKFEILYYVIFFLMLIEEIIILITVFNKVNVFMDKIQQPKNPNLSQKLIGTFSYFFNCIKTLIFKTILGIFKYVSNFSNMLNIVGLVCTAISLRQWTNYVSVIQTLHSVDFNQLDKLVYQKQYTDMLGIIEQASYHIKFYRKMTGLLAGIYSLKLATVIFRFFPKLSYFFDSLINSMANNLYYLFFLFMINLGVSLFTHFYFGGSIVQFSTKFKSFVVVFATILGYTDGISLMLDAEPLIATITLEIYYFLVIMILINMFIIFVNSEFKQQEKKREIYLKSKEVRKNNFEYNPFFTYKLRESLDFFFNFQIYYYTDKIKFHRLKIQRESEKVSHKIAQYSYQNINWDVDFQRVRDINFKVNNSLAAIAKVSYSDITEILRDKTVRHIWKFICLFVVLLLHICIIFVIYSPLEGDYGIMLSKVQMVLREGSKQMPQKFTPIPFSDFHMRAFLLDLNNFWFSKRTVTTKPFKIFQVGFRNEYLQPVYSNMIEIKNVKMIHNRWDKHDFESVSPFRYSILGDEAWDGEDFIIDREKPPKFRNFKFEFEGIDGVESIPHLKYRFDENFKSFIADLDHRADLVDSYFIKLVGDNMIGPYTQQVSSKSLLYNNLTKFYVLAEVRLKRNIGDMYSIHFHYNQLSTHDMIKKYFYLFPSAVIIKSMIFIVLLFRSVRKIWRTNYEYNLWYKIGIQNELPEYLQMHRSRKKPEFIRRLKHLYSIDDVLLWSSTAFFCVFWVYFCFQLIDKKKFLASVDLLVKGEALPEEVYFQGIELANLRFKMNFFAGFEVLLLTFSVLLSLRRIKFFKVILESFYIIFSNLAALVIIMTLLILTFAVMIGILLGDKYKMFVNPFRIHNLTGILISFKNLITFTDNFDMFTTLVFMIPYFVLIKYTVLFMIIAIIYSSISTAEKKVAEREKIESSDMVWGEFIKRTLVILFGKKNDMRNGLNQTIRYIQGLNFSCNQEIYNKLMDSFSYTEKKVDKSSWKRMLGDAAIKEFYERDKISTKHQVIIFKLISFMVENQKNLFLKAKNSEKFRLLVKKLINFYKSYYKYYRYGNKNLIRQISREMKIAHDFNKKQFLTESREIKKNKLKMRLYKMQGKIDEMIGKICIYRLVMRSIKEDAKQEEEEEIEENPHRISLNYLGQNQHLVRRSLRTSAAQFPLE